MAKPQFTENQIYHVYNRGVEKRNVFLDRTDHLRFIHDLYEMNDAAATANVLYYFNPKSMEVEPQYIQPTGRKHKRKLLVEILVFTLMPNHYHLLLRQKSENGIVKFMQKLGTAYTMYFNKKYERVGALFQGRFKAVRVETDAHFLYVPFYIHANPVFKKRQSDSLGRDAVVRTLAKYKWSSFQDYIGKQNFPSVTSRDFLLSFHGGEKQFLQETKRLLREYQPEKVVDEIGNIVLEDVV